MYYVDVLPVATREKIITDYKTKAVNVDAYQRSRRGGTIILTHQEKLKTIPDNR